MIRFKHLIAAALLAVTASGASAATFNFSGVQIGLVNSLDFSVDGIDLNIRAGTFGPGNPASITFNRRIDRDPFIGIAASRNILDGQTTGGPGSQNDEVLVFNFDQKVRIEEVLFGFVDGNDDFRFGKVDGTSLSLAPGGNVDLTNQFLGLDLFDFSIFGTDAVGSSFGIGARQNNDDFRILAMEVAPVPLPAAGFMLLAGLGGMAALRRRNTTQTA